MTAMTADTSSAAAVLYAVLGGKFRLLLTRDEGIGRREAAVLDAAGNRIGYASDSIYAGRGWAVHTGPYAGYVPEAQIEYDAAPADVDTGELYDHDRP
jgi:hypothetical protein